MVVVDLLRIIACVVTVAAVALASSAPAPAPTAATSQSAGGYELLDVDAFLKRRCGTEDGRPALWSYEGRLTDPSSGRVVAEVEGLELIRQIPSADGLFSKRILDGSSSWDSARSVLCRRVFCYKRPSSGSNRSSSKDGTNELDSSPGEGGSLLTSIRLRPDGPLRHLDPSECVAAYDTAITYVSRNKGRELFVISERGGKASCPEEEEDLSKYYYLMGAAKISPSNDSTLFGYSILARSGVAQIDGGDIQLPPTELLSHSSDDEVVVSPPRSRLLQFGKGDGSSSSDRKYGSIRETYNFRFDGETSEVGAGGLLARLRRSIGKSDHASAPKESTVQYSRYGESPPWYAPGRSCTLALQGRRLDDRPRRDIEYSSQQLPPTASWLADKCGFWSGWPAQFSVRRCAGGSNHYQSSEEHEGSLGQQAVKMIKNDNCLTTSRLKDEQPFENSYKKSAIENAFSYVGARARRISSSFVLSEVPE
mmetsp:Transcript_15724/g.36220  ORF Transcript_15724/g.36220 Transcript_15724/m.36220 type:complete len:480 (+) Transcript_15724:56-1495(+)